MSVIFFTYRVHTMKKLFPAVLAAFLTVLLSACSGPSGIGSREDILDKTVCVLSGSVSDGIVERMDPDIDLVRCDTLSSLKELLRDGGADCAVVDKSTADKLTGLLTGFRTAEEPYARLDYVIAVSAENRLMLGNLNAALGALRRSGRLEELTGESRGDTGDTAEPSGASTVTVAVEPDFFPFAYYDEEGGLAGIEIDLVREICAELDLTPEFLPVEADMLLYMAQSGKCSFAVGRLTAGEKEGLSFSDSYMDSTQYIIVKK